MTVRELNIILGNNIKKYRKLKGFSRDELAEKLGVTRNMPYRWERGMALASGMSLVLLAQFFDVEVWQLFYTEKTDE